MKSKAIINTFFFFIAFSCFQLSASSDSEKSSKIEEAETLESKESEFKGYSMADRFQSRLKREGRGINLADRIDLGQLRGKSAILHPHEEKFIQRRKSYTSKASDTYLEASHRRRQSRVESI
jgi:hypothetical protein